MSRIQEFKSDDDLHSDNESGYTDDDDPTVPPPVLSKDDVQIAFDEIIADARSGKRKLGTKEKRTEFLDQYRDVLSKKTQAERQTLLHIIANKLEHKALARCVLQRNKALLEHRDEYGKTAIHYAIVKRNLYFLEVVLKVIPDGPSLDKILGIECEHARNCIHLAIYHGGGLNKEKEKEYNGLTIELIQRASDATLCAIDQNGLTPLHLAVEYHRSSEAQLRVIRALIARGDGAFDKFTTKPKELSVYQYHQYTRTQATKKVSESLEIRGAEKLHEALPSVVVSSHKNMPIKSKSKEVANRDGAEITLSNRREPGNLSIMMPPHVKTMLGDHSFAATIGRESSAKNPRPDADLADSEPQKLERRTTGLVAQNRKDEENERRKAEFADKICKELKLHYLRSTFMSDRENKKRDQLNASRFLHGANIENINLCFDYSDYLGAPKIILKESFLQSYDHMSFDEVLRYVSFRRIELQKSVKPATDSRLSKHLPKKAKAGRGRDDLTFFFKWLYDKNVRHIIKVRVDDSQDPPHSDKAIENSLGWFEIDTLSWSRMDLDSETLRKACQNVRELYLRWSGSRAILRAWGEPDGLPRLKNLERVHLIWNSEQTLESADRIDSYVKEFQKRLDQSLQDVDMSQKDQEEEGLPNDNNNDSKVSQRKILVYTDKENDQNSEQLVSGASTKTLANTNDRNLQSHRWLECMDNFADEIQNLRVSGDKYSGDLKREIKVALIDDGADPEVQSLRGKIKGGESFDRGNPHENGPSPYYTSSQGHGTVMADMICRVCPMAKLYVYKLETHSSTNPGTPDQISAESAALAVKAAVDQKVDVISMSWTVKEVEENYNSIKQLGEAIKLALDARILLFCSAADTGALSETEYPWAYDQRRIFRIGAATADGTIWGPTGSRDKVSFILPGHNVVSRNPHREGALPSDFKERTGSSIATALAAGLASLILHCVRLGAIHSEIEMQQGIKSAMAVKTTDFQQMKDHHNMNAVLKHIGLDEGQQKFIEVWRRFDGPTANLRSPSNNIDGTWEQEGITSELAVIAKLARDLVSGIVGGK